MRTDPTYPTNANTRIPVSVRTRELVKAQKRGVETYDRLLRRMVDQYDPERAER